MWLLSLFEGIGPLQSTLKREKRPEIKWLTDQEWWGHREVLVDWERVFQGRVWVELGNSKGERRVWRGKVRGLFRASIKMIGILLEKD